MPTASTAAPWKTEQIHDDKVGEGEWQGVGRIYTLIAKLISTLSFPLSLTLRHPNLRHFQQPDVHTDVPPNVPTAGREPAPLLLFSSCPKIPGGDPRTQLFQVQLPVPVPVASPKPAD